LGKTWKKLETLKNYWENLGKILRKPWKKHGKI
jgi:hypothetical protein